FIRFHQQFFFRQLHGLSFYGRHRALPFMAKVANYRRFRIPAEAFLTETAVFAGSLRPDGTAFIEQFSMAI
ncbi:MAG TPA: hypothetical protein DCG00_07325, partial [Alistipes sp.]|nr:hypothetical protein [Alistipes sp.]